MEIKQIASVELCRNKPFKHEIIFRDSTGYPIDRMKVEEYNEWEVFSMVYKKWCEHPDFAGKAKERE